MRRLDTIAVMVGCLSCGSRTGIDVGGAAGPTGLCAPGAAAGTVVTLSATAVWPYAIVLDAHNAYWTDWIKPDEGAGVIVAMPLCGGQPATLAGGQSLPSAIAVDASSVYWVNLGAPPYVGNGSVARCPIEGGAVTTLASGQDQPTALALGAGTVYWTTPTAVFATPVAGGAITTLASGQSPTSIATDSTSVYWATGNGPSAVLKAPLGGGEVTTVVSTLMLGPGEQLTTMVLVGVAQARIYWQSGLWLISAPVTGGSVVTLASSEQTASAVDASGVYWSAGQQIMRMPLDGGTRVPFASASYGPAGGIALNATSVAWTTGDVYAQQGWVFAAAK